MNKHINSFDSILDYNAASESILLPAVSYIKTTKNVIYDVEFTTDKNVAQPGWVAYKENGIVTYYNPKSPELTELTLSNIAGIVVIPTSHTQDGTVRVVSIDFMDYNNPTTGSSSAVNLYWGPTTDVTGITNINKVAAYVTGTTTTTLVSGNCRFGTNYDLSSIELSQQWWFDISVCTDNENYNFISKGANYPGDTSGSTYNQIPVPYTISNSKNSDYFTTPGSILTQGLCGTYNTDKIMAMVDHTGAITNEYTTGHYPATECCRAYKDGSYYLPSIAELGYLVASFKEVDNVRETLGLSTLTGKYYWSSSCYSSYGAWGVNFGLSGRFGDCSNSLENGGLSVLAFVAF